MPIDHWLSALAQHGHAHVQDDLEDLATKAYPFLSDQCASNQIERLSGHLNGLKSLVRKQVIAYSLYIRQLDVLLQAGARNICSSGCPRPPVGCCTGNYFITLNTLDLMSAQQSPLALHMAHSIGILQKLESSHNLAQGQRIKPGYCHCLAEDGCTIRLFKSPRCAHYLCDAAAQGIQGQQEGDAAPFLAAMHYTVSSPISTTRDFMNPDVISEGAALFRPMQALPHDAKACRKGV